MSTIPVDAAPWPPARGSGKGEPDVFRPNRERGVETAAGASALVATPRVVHLDQFRDPEGKGRRPCG
jgi:hypothetical protein